MADDRREEIKENIIAVIVVLLIIAVAGWWIFIKMTAPPPDQERVLIPIAGSPTMGMADAPVAIVIFSDFECPFCARFALETMPQLDTYVENGTILLVFKQFPLDTHPNAALAAQASLCADDQDSFWQYHDLLYANQDALAADDLSGYAAEAGLNATRFETCMQRPAERVAQEKLLGKQLGVTGTPTFYFNGRKVAGFLTADEFIAEIEKELG